MMSGLVPGVIRLLISATVERRMIMDKSFMRKVLLRTVFFLFLFDPVLGAVPSLKVEPAPLRIADDRTATVKVVLEWPDSEGPYEINTTEPALENLTLVRQSQSQETGALVKQVVTYEFQPAGKGPARILPFEVSYRRSDADPWVPLLVPEQGLEIVPSAPGRILRISLWFAAGIALFTAAGLVIRKVAARREAAKSTVVIDPKQKIYAKAQEAITTFTPSDPKERLGHCAAQLRIVASVYYDIPPGALTETAFLALLKKKNLPAAEWAEVSGLFEQLEQMRFSRGDLTAYELERMQKTLLQYIQGKIIMGNPV